MSDKFELYIRKIIKSEQISPGDELSKKISALQYDELDEEQLELVAAANKEPDYEKIKSLIDNKE